jgi:hypothetical protein
LQFGGNTSDAFGAANATNVNFASSKAAGMDVVATLALSPVAATSLTLTDKLLRLTDHKTDCKHD